jgi:REP element-mobilizing transposase RayT
VFLTRFRRRLLHGFEAGVVADEILLLEAKGAARVLAWCVMPDHVHVLLVPTGGALSKALQALKGRTSAALKPRHPEVDRMWERRYFDRRIRSEPEISLHAEYIELNPVKAGLCACPEDWPWSSASTRRKEDTNDPP